MARYVSWMSVATLLRAPAPHSASSFAFAALSLKGVSSAFSALGFSADELPASRSRRVSGGFLLCRRLDELRRMKGASNQRCLEVTEGSVAGRTKARGGGTRQPVRGQMYALSVAAGC